MLPGAPIWFPNAPPSGVLKLQRIQNSALRIATGSMKISSKDHLHSETLVFPVHNHLSLLCSQFLLSALCLAHSYAVVTSESDPRTRGKKKTIQSLFLTSVSHLLSGGPTDRHRVNPSTDKTSLADLHTTAVQAATSQLEPNPILHSPIPLLSRKRNSPFPPLTYSPVPAPLRLLLFPQLVPSEDRHRWRPVLSPVPLVARVTTPPVTCFTAPLIPLTSECRTFGRSLAGWQNSW